VKLTLEVPYGDIDAMGHLNNVAYLRYLEWARQKYWLAMRDTDDFWKIDFVVARAEIDYRAPAHMGDLVEIEIRVSRMGPPQTVQAYAPQMMAAAAPFSAAISYL